MSYCIDANKITELYLKMNGGTAVSESAKKNDLSDIPYVETVDETSIVTCLFPSSKLKEVKRKTDKALKAKYGVTLEELNCDVAEHDYEEKLFLVYDSPDVRNDDNKVMEAEEGFEIGDVVVFNPKTPHKDKGAIGRIVEIYGLADGGRLYLLRGDDGEEIGPFKEDFLELAEVGESDDAYVAKGLIDARKRYGRDSMFSKNERSDDIAILVNLIEQMKDGTFEEASVFDDVTRTEYGVEDVLGYLRGKYGENL